MGSSFVDGSMSSVFSSEFSVDPNWLRCIAQTHRLPTVWVACCGNTWFQKLTMYQLWNYSDIGAVWMSFYWRTHPRQKFWHGGRQRRQQRVDFLVCHKSQTLILPLSASRQVLHPSSNCGRNAAPSHLPWNWCQLERRIHLNLPMSKTWKPWHCWLVFIKVQRDLRDLKLDSFDDFKTEEIFCWEAWKCMNCRWAGRNKGSATIKN